MATDVKFIGAVDDFDGNQVRVGIDYGTVTVSAPVPGGNRLADKEFVEFMTLLQQAYEDPDRQIWAEDEGLTSPQTWRGGIVE